MGVSVREMSGNADTIALLDDVIGHRPAALITTVDAHGIMHTRQLPNPNTRFNGDLDFFSTNDAELVSEIRAHPDVLVTYTDRSSGRFVVANGSADVRDDRERIRTLWTPALAKSFPNGPGDPALALIHVNVEGVDLWD